MYLEKSKQILPELIHPDEWIPCSDAEIGLLESALGLPIPAAFKEFLAWIGKGAGDFMMGSDFYYECMFGLREDAQELLDENNFPKPLPNDAIVFFMHQGYQFAFIKVSDGNHSPVYYYNEAYHDTDFKCTDSFDEYLTSRIRTAMQIDAYRVQLRAQRNAD